MLRSIADLKYHGVTLFVFTGITKKNMHAGMSTISTEEQNNVVSNRFHVLFQILVFIHLYSTFLPF